MITSGQNPDIDKQPEEPSSGSSNALRWFLNGLILLLLPIIGISAYVYFSPKPPPPAINAAAPVREDTIPAQASQRVHPARVVQIDVLNGCGAKGIGAKFTSFLRSRGFDVVESRNYKSSRVSQTLVLDRVGDLGAARRVAAALGVAEKNVVQQLNPDYYVDVSVVIGKDFSGINPAFAETKTEHGKRKTK